jgi:hypothetical protein
VCSRWLIFDREYGGDTFLRNVGSHTDYKVPHRGRWKHSYVYTVLNVNAKMMFCVFVLHSESIYSKMCYEVTQFGCRVSILVNS